DPIRDRLVVFGGQGYAGSTNDLWAFHLSGIPHWTKLLPSGTPPSPRSFHTAVYDSLNDRMIVFGGNDGAVRNDVWSLSFAGNPTWTLLSPGGTAPAPRELHVATFDRARNRMLVHGGSNGGTRHADVWALSLGAAPAWAPVAAAGTSPGGRSAHCALVDAAADRMVIFAGLGSTGAPTNSAWALSLGATPTWSPLTVTGTPPTARYGMSARYDALRRRALFFGGGIGAPNSSETWALSLNGPSAWTLLPAPNPPQGRQFHSSAYDPFGDRMLVFGGSSGPVLSDTWALPLASPGASWIPLTSTRRRGHTALHDPSRQRMVVFGGESGTQLNDVWELGLDDAGTWARLNPSGTPPAVRALHGAIYDERRDRMIVFGGRGGPPLGDLWELTFSGSLEWRPIQALGTPPPARFDHVMVYDEARSRVLVFGGMGANGAFNDAWTLTLTGTPTWQALVPAGTKPGARAGAQAVYDPLRDRLVVFGGYTGAFAPLNDAWQLSFATTTPTWAAMAPTGTKPSPRFAAATVYDPSRDRAVFASGTDFNDFFADTWELRFIGT
ncbi:MAG: kelch repeat-containing protein, partial [Candidatus Eisenbacteria bacterium]